jgi:uncharacterized protein (TIGR02246 family)
MKGSASLPLTAVIAASLLTVAAAAPSSFAQSGSSQNAADQSSPVFKTISDLARQYEQAYNSGDAKKVASFCAEDVDYIDQNGDETKGRDQIERMLAGAFQANSGAKLDLAVEEVRQLAPDVIVEKGTATVTPTDGAAESTRYVAIHVKKGDAWEISQLTETPAPPPNAYAVLQNLGWLVGTWQDKDGDLTVQTTINWAGDKNFLARTFKITSSDKSESQGWEIIGWDPVLRRIRSWIFDSNGGFGQSTWVNDGDNWLIQASNVLPNGSVSTAEHVLTRVDDNKFTWESQNRTLDGEPQPSLDKVEVTRVSAKK